MTKQNQIYRCLICGNVIEVLHTGAGELVCCGQPMKLLIEKNEEDGKEKHIPVMEKTDSGIKVKVGSIPHPMEEKHYIEWIEINTETNKSEKNFLKPGDKPETIFDVNGKMINVRIYCNVHGLWKLSE